MNHIHKIVSLQQQKIGLGLNFKFFLEKFSTFGDLNVLNEKIL